MEMPERFMLVEQPKGSLVCGAACCAMATGQTLDQVLSEVAWQHLAYTSGIVAYLGSKGISMGVWVDGGGINEDVELSFSWRGRPAILAVESGRKEHDHWVFWDGTRILDPIAGQHGKQYTLLESHFLTYWPGLTEEEINKIALIEEVEA